MSCVPFGLGNMCNHANSQVFLSTLDAVGFVLPWMNTSQHPLLPATLDYWKSILFYLADTTQFLHSLTLVSHAFGVSFFSASFLLRSSALPLLFLLLHSVASSFPQPSPLYNYVI